MDTVVRYVCFLGLVLLLCGCGRYNERRWMQEYLAAAEDLMEEQPDSALTLLQSIPESAILPEAQQMVYRLRLLQAKDKCGWSITADTGIVSAQRYFERRSDWPHAALAAFYRARVWQERNDDRQAMKVYVEAETYAARTDDHRLKGMIQHNIGWIYYTHQDYETAIPIIKKAIDYAQQADTANYTRVIAGLQLLGGVFLGVQQPDSAVYCCRQALAIAEAHKDDRLQADLFHSLAVIYRDAGKTAQSEMAIENVRSLAPEGIDIPRFYVTLSKFYTKNQQFDLAAIYAHRTLELLDTIKEVNVVRAGAYAALQELEQARGRYKQALDYYRQYIEELLQVYQDNREHSVAGLQEKYALALIQNAHQQLTIRHQQTNRLLLFVLIAFILTAFAFYYYHTKKKSALLAMEQQMIRLKALAANYDEKDKTLKNILIRNFDVIRKLSVLEDTLNQEDKQTGVKLLRKFKAIVFDTQDRKYWESFYHTIDSYCNGRLYVLKDSYPALTDTEFKVCCLCLADFKNEAMAAFLGFSINTIQTTKTGIRKRLQLEGRGDIKAFLEQKIAGLSPQ